jgi:hypothetical protein
MIAALIDAICSTDGLPGISIPLRKDETDGSISFNCTALTGAGWLRCPIGLG